MAVMAQRFGRAIQDRLLTQVGSTPAAATSFKKAEKIRHHSIQQHT